MGGWHSLSRVQQAILLVAIENGSIPGEDAAIARIYEMGLLVMSADELERTRVKIISAIEN
jgi:hypothetical protein